MFPTPNSVPTAIKTRALRIPNDPNIWGAVYGALVSLTKVKAWEQVGTVPAETMAEVMADILDDMNEYGEAIVIGAILPYMSDEPPPHTLKCDGATYNRVDYPRLYAALSPVFQLTADTFFVPDLRSQFVMGAANDGEIGNNGGEAEHTLTVEQIPAHSHTNDPHGHSDVGHAHGIGYTITTLVVEPGEVPALTPVPLVPNFTATGFANITNSAVTIDNTGGGEAHNNLPPFTKLNYCVLAE